MKTSICLLVLCFLVLAALKLAGIPLAPGRNASLKRPPFAPSRHTRTARDVVQAQSADVPSAALPCEWVVLVHGLNRSHRAMKKLESALRADGYRVITCDYPSRHSDIETLTTNLFATLAPQVTEAQRVHFVTHSLGGILLRTYLQEHTIPNLGRVVMLGPPNRGSEAVDKLDMIPLVRWINGPAGSQLGTGTASLPLRLKVPPFELGVIAGDRSVNPILSLLIPGQDDGKVSVVRTQTEGMRDFIRLHATHTCMMWNRQVIRQTRHFLKHGIFQKDMTAG